MQLTSLIEALTDVLNQERILLDEVDSATYTEPGAGAFHSSIGAHIRHNLDHFTSFFSGLAAGNAIDYEARRRDDGIARSTEHAMADLDKHIDALERLAAEPDRAVRVREESNDARGEDLNWLESSLGRELQFLLGHTVHHHAIMALLLSEKGVDLPNGFGVAPSTQRYEKQR